MMKNFEIKCKKCDGIAIVEMRESASYRNDVFYEYPIIVSKKCKIEERLSE